MVLGAVDPPASGGGGGGPTGGVLPYIYVYMYIYGITILRGLGWVPMYPLYTHCLWAPPPPHTLFWGHESKKNTFWGRCVRV